MSKAMVMQCELLHVRDVNNLENIRMLEISFTKYRADCVKNKNKIMKPAGFEPPAF